MLTKKPGAITDGVVASQPARVLMNGSRWPSVVASSAGEPCAVGAIAVAYFWVTNYSNLSGFLKQHWEVLRQSDGCRDRCFHHHALGSIRAQRTKSSRPSGASKKRKTHFFFFNFWNLCVDWAGLLRASPASLITCKWVQDGLRQQCFLVWWLAGAVVWGVPLFYATFPRKARGSCTVVAAPSG